jgi:hypothetical protein
MHRNVGVHEGSVPQQRISPAPLVEHIEEVRRLLRR